MLKINKLKNVYGIKELKNSTLIDNNTIIYAPNGVMKTSFSDGVKSIVNGKIPQDVFCNPPLNACFEIDNNGTIIDENTQNLTLDAFVFDSNDYEGAFQDENFTSLVMSKDLKVKYKSVLDSYNNEKKHISDLISTCVFDKKKGDSKDIINMEELLNCKGEEGIVKALPNMEAYTDEFYKNLEINTIFNDKTSSIFTTPEFISKLNNYNTYIDKKMDEKIFNSDFTLKSLTEIRDLMKKNKFFDAGHKVLINTRGEMDLNQLNDFIDETTKEIYGTDEEKNLFYEAVKIFDKNQKTKDFTNYIKSNKRCFSELKDPTELKKKIVYSKLNSRITEIKAAKINFEQYKIELAKILNDAKQHLGIWESVLNNYNSRFLCNKLDVVITNITESVLGMETPRFRRTIKGTNIEVNEQIFKRFSSGEKRAILILNLMFEIELRKGKKYTLILDDIADSFDYKNKYAIIECLKDIAEDSNIQLLILTHNFDFYRSVRIALGDKIQSKLMASANNNIVTLCNASQKWYEDYSYFKNWKNNDRNIDLIAVLPFLRNIAELQNDGNKNDNDYKTLTNFLHYNPNLEGKNITDIDTIYNNANVKHNNKSFVYLDELEVQMNNIISNRNLKESNLEEKIVLGIYIRIYTDRFMYKRYEYMNNAAPYLADSCQSNDLFSQVSNYLNEEEKNKLKTAFTVAPSFIHVNSFMYEPLVDVGFEKLIEVAKDINSLVYNRT